MRTSIRRACHKERQFFQRQKRSCSNYLVINIYKQKILFWHVYEEDEFMSFWQRMTHLQALQRIVNEGK